MVDVITYRGLLAKNIPPIEFLVDLIIPKSGITFVCGPPGTFKTNLLLYTSIQGNIGKRVLDFDVKEPFTTLWIDEENRDIGMKDKLVKITNGLNLSQTDFLKNNILMISQNFKLIDDKYNKILIEILERYHPNMIVIDSLTKVFPLSQRDEDDIKKIYDQLKLIIDKYKVSFVFIHHTRKGDGKHTIGLDDIAGSRELAAMADSAILVEHKFKNTYSVRQVKSRHGIMCDGINFKVHGDDDSMVIDYSGTINEGYTQVKHTIAAHITEWIMTNDIKSFSRKEVHKVMIDNFKHKKSSIDQAIIHLVSVNYIGKDPEIYGNYRVLK